MGEGAKMAARIATVLAVARLRLGFHEATDPVTGDQLTAGEMASRAIQRIMRRWAFLGAISLVTLVCWLLGDTARTWWNYGASYAAIVIESIVGMFFFGQSLRDAVIIRRLERMEREHGDMLRAIYARVVGEEVKQDG